MRLTSSNEESGVRRAPLSSLLGTLRIAGCIGLAAGIVSIALHFVGTSLLLLVIAASLVPFGIIAAAVGVVLLAVGRSPRMCAVAVLITIVGAATQMPLYVQTDAGPGVRVNVMQANILFDGASADTVVDLVQKNRVDILTVNELTEDAVKALYAAGLDELLPYSFVRPEDFADGTGIYSRFPLTRETVHTDFILNNLSATAAIPDVGPVSVFALHPVPPPYSASDWDAEMVFVKELLANAAGPGIVGADFNATYDHAQFRDVLGTYQDAAEQTGSGNLFTYPTDKWGFPIVGVDHVLVAGGTATSVETLDLPGSDHRALVATVILKGT